MFYRKYMFYESWNFKKFLVEELRVFNNIFMNNWFFLKRIIFYAFTEKYRICKWIFNFMSEILDKSLLFIEKIIKLYCFFIYFFIEIYREFKKLFIGRNIFKMSLKKRGKTNKLFYLWSIKGIFKSFVSNF